MKVELSKTARKQLAKAPPQIVRKFAIWADLVRVDGIEAACAIPGFRDHVLQGAWQGYRAVRLSQAYRAIYIIHSDGRLETIFVEEVNKHDY